MRAKLRKSNLEMAKIAMKRQENVCYISKEGFSNRSAIGHGGIIVLHEPFHYNDSFFSLYGIWADYLEKEGGIEATQRLKVMGIAPNSPCPNYLDLLTSDPDVGVWIKKSLPRSAGHYTKINEYYHLNGIDIRLPISRMLKGHGNQFFYKNFDQVHGAFLTASQSLEKGTPYKTIHEKLSKFLTKDEIIRLKNSWEQYEMYFEFLPPKWHIAPYKPVWKELLDFVGEENYAEESLKKGGWVFSLGRVFYILEELRSMYLKNA